MWGRRNTVEAILPQIDTYFYGEQGQVLVVDDHQSFREVARLQQDIYEDEKKLLRKYSHEKSTDFLASEAAAREYLTTLGFEDLPPIYLVDDDPDDMLLMRKHAPTIAEVNSFTNSVFVRQSRLQETNAYNEPQRISSILVHELMHTTGPTSSIGVQLAPQSEHGEKLFCRSGFIVTNDDKIRGRFFEEGLAEYVGSRYRRRMVGDQNTLGIVGVPSLAIPEYLVQPDHAMTSGPDGYAIELLAYGVENKGIMNAEMFTELLLDTRRNNTRLVALRTFAQVLECLETGLYSKLHSVAYDKTSWQDACAYVHSVVTR